MELIQDYAGSLQYWQTTAHGLTTLPELSVAARAVVDVPESGERAAARAILLRQAETVGCRADLDRVFRGLESDRALARVKEAQPDAEAYPYLERDGQGRIKRTIGNFAHILQTDPFFAPLRYDELAEAPVSVTEQLGVITASRRWTDADDAAAMNHIEETYGLFDRRKFRDAFLLKLQSVRYHPVKDLVERAAWDGKPRIETFLCDWAGCEDSAYTREVSRLIFAGGIHRLYEPGCKFDYLPVLIGTRQGEGKSTLVRWLALRDEWFGEITVFEGKEAVEQLRGVFVAEATELLALKTTREQEAVKSFLSRQRDKYRRPYAEHVEDVPRRSIIIGTTNNRTFLRDKTGNRRFLPVEVHSAGSALFSQEAECRAHILQCWAEALALYRDGALRPVPDERLRGMFRAAQDAAMEDDWRVGTLRKYLEEKPAGCYVCIRELFCDALQPDTDYPKPPTRRDSVELSQIMDRMPGWERAGNISFTQYGMQMSWKKTVN